MEPLPPLPDFQFCTHFFLSFVQYAIENGTYRYVQDGSALCAVCLSVPWQSAPYKRGLTMEDTNVFFDELERCGFRHPALRLMDVKWNQRCIYVLTFYKPDKIAEAMNKLRASVDRMTPTRDIAEYLACRNESWLVRIRRWLTPDQADT